MRTTAGVLAVLAAVALAACGGDGDGGGERPGPARAAVVGERRVAPRILDLTIRSPALGARARVRLLTPDGWSRTTGRRWPVLYLLHGCCDTYDSWTRETRVERLRALREVLVVLPEGGEVGFYSDWAAVDGEDGPGWETFHLTELRRILERDYGAGTRRAVAGLSMGGLGAIGYAARRPDLFAAAASFSGVLRPLADAQSLLGLFSAYTPDALAVWGDPVADRATWARHDPTELAAELRDTPVFVSSGDGRPGPLDPDGAGDDEIERQVHRESRAFVRRMRELDIPVQARFYGPGGHVWPYWERELVRALPLLLGALRPGG